MLKVIQVKIQEQASCRKKNSEFAWFDWSRDKLDRSRVVSVEFELSPNNSLSSLRIRVSNLLLLVYKGSPKHDSYKAFQREKSVPPLYLGFCTQKALMSSTSVIPWRISRSDVVEIAVFSSHQSCWWFKPSRAVLESQTGEFVFFFITSVGAYVAKA